MNSQSLNTYLSKIGLEKAAPSLSFLEALQSGHIAHFSFNSISPLLGELMPLDVESLFDKIVLRGRGGYCFEQNKLFYETLKSLGFNVRLVLARVLLTTDSAPLTHRITIIEFDGITYSVDVGFGPQGPRSPIPIAIDLPCSRNGFSHRIIQNENDEFFLQIKSRTDYRTLYSFELNNYSDEDCKLGHFYSHKNPGATFVNNLVVSIIEDEWVHSLRNTLLRKFNSDGFTDTKIEDADQLRIILSDIFSIQLSKVDCDRLYSKTLLASGNI